MDCFALLAMTLPVFGHRSKSVFSSSISLVDQPTLGVEPKVSEAKQVRKSRSILGPKVPKKSLGMGIWLFPILALWFSLALGSRPFAPPDEGRYVEIPREMVATGDYVTPRLNGVKYFEKPPLFYWLQAGSIKLFGINEWSMRLWCVFFALLGCMGAYLFGKRFYHYRVGMASCLILATSPLYYALSRLIVLDMAMTTLLSLSLFSFLLAVYTPPGWARRLWAWGFYACSALGVLIKGLMALAIPGPVILIWALTANRWKNLWPAYLPSGTFIFLAIAVPWHLLVALKNPEFLHKYFIVEHVLRYTTSVHMRTQHFLFFVPVLILGFFPWTSVLGNAIRQALKTPSSGPQSEIVLFLLIWAGWTFGFFSFSNSKLVPYILPCFPPLALVLGIYWDKIWQVPSSSIARQGIWAFIISTVVLGTVSLIVLWRFPELIDHRPHLGFDFTILMGIFLALGTLAFILMRQNALRTTLTIMPVTSVILILFLIRVMPELQRPSIKPLAQTIQAIKEKEDIIGSYRVYYQDLPVYVDQIVTVIDVKGEMEFGCDREDCSKWMIAEKDFLGLWKSKKRLLIITRMTELVDLLQRHPTFHYIPLGVDQESILITNR